MLATILGFGGRIGRLPFVLWNIALFCCIVVLSVTLAFGVFDPTNRASSFSAVMAIMLLGGLASAWVSLALCAKRFRDIGWTPIYVIPAWFGFSMLDQLVTVVFPALQAGPAKGSYLGLIVDLAMTAALFLWPGRDPDYEVPDYAAIRRETRSEQFTAQLRPPPTASVKARAVAAGGPVSFGRRRP